MKEDQHVAAFAMYELGSILVKSPAVRVVHNYLYSQQVQWKQIENWILKYMDILLMLQGQEEAKIYFNKAKVRLSIVLSFLAHLVLSLCNHALSIVVISSGIGICVQPSQWQLWS